MLLHLQVYIKESIIFSAQTQVVGKDLGLSTLMRKRPRFEHINDSLMIH